MQIKFQNKCGFSFQKKKFDKEKVTHCYEKFDAVKEIENMDGSGIYQQKVLFLMIIMIFTCSFAQYSLPFTFLVPQTYCYDQSGELTQCSLQQACKNQENFVAQNFQFVSFQVQFNQICNGSFVDNIQSIILIIASLGSFAMNFLQDIYGRVKVIYVTIVIGICSFYLVGFGQNLKTVVLGISLSLLYNDTLCSCFYSYFPEIMGKKIRNKTSGTIFLSMTFANVIITYITNYLMSYQQIAQIGFYVNFIGILVIIYFVETPLYYQVKGDLLNLYRSLEYISQQNLLNFRETNAILQERIFSQQIEIKKCTQFQIKTTKKETKFLRKEKLHLFYVFFVDIQIYLASFIYVLAPNQIGFQNNIRLNLYITTLGELIGYFFISFYSIKIKRTNFFIFYVNSSLILALISMAIYNFKFHSQTFKEIILLLISFLQKLLIGSAFAMLFNYIAEIVRTQVRGLAIGIMVFSGRMIVSILPVILNLQKKFNLSPFSFVVLLSLINQIFVYKLPMTLNKKMKQIISIKKIQRNKKNNLNLNNSK